MYGMLNDMDWATSGRLASLMGAIKISHQGGQNHQPGRAEIADRFETAFGYRFYEKLAGGARILLGGSTGTNVFFTVTNFVLGSSRTFAVTATNLTGESSESPAYVAPVIEPAPGNLRPVSFFLTSPVPGVVELSQDLTNWTDRIRVRSASASSADIELVQAPRYPILFGRVKTNSPSMRFALPLPR